MKKNEHFLTEKIRIFQKQFDLNLKFNFGLILLLLHFVIGSEAIGQTITTTTTWSALNPAAGANIIINSGGSLTVDVPSAVCASITINNATNGGSSTLTIASTNSLTVNGAISMSTPAGTSTTSTVAVGSGSLTCTSFSMSSTSTTRFSQLTLSTGTINVNGNFIHAGSIANNKVIISNNGIVTIHGDFTAGNSTITAGSGTFVFNGTSAQAVSGANAFNNVTIANTSNPITVSGATTINGLLSISPNTTLTAGAALTMSAVTVNSLGTLAINTASTQNGILTMNGTVSGTSTLTLNGTSSLFGSGTFSNSQVIMGGNRVFDASSSLTLSTVYINSGTSVTNNGNTTITSGLDGNHASSSVWINAANSTLNLGGTIMSPTGVLTATANPNTVNYTGATQTVKATTYHNLTLSGTGDKTIASGTIINGLLSIAPTGSARALIGTGLNIAVDKLSLGGIGRTNGTWGSTTATSATYQNNTFFAATTGILTVATNSATVPTVTPIIGSYTFTNAANGPNSATNTGTGSSYSYSYSGTAFDATSYGPIATRPTKAGNYTVTVTVAPDGAFGQGVSAATAFIINKVIPTVTPTVSTYVYTGSANGPSSATNTGTGTVYTFSYNGTAFDLTTHGPNATRPTKAGDYSVTATVAASSDGNYGSNTSASINFTIAKAIPTVTPTIGTYTFNGTVNGPTLATNTGTSTGYTFSYTGTAFDTSTYSPSATRPTNAGNYTVTVSLTASTDGNFDAGISTATPFTINKITPTVTPTVLTYSYNGNFNGPTVATNTGTSTSYSFSYTGTAFDATLYSASATRPIKAGNYTVTVTVLASADGNYNLNTTAATAFTINQVALTIRGLMGVSRVYNGLTTTTATGTATYDGLQNSETFTVTGTAAFNFDNKNIGIGKTIIVTGFTAPNSNYTLIQPTGLTADITTAALTINGISGVNRAYNGLTNASSTGTAAYVGLQTGDSFPVTGTAVLNFSDALVGTGKTIIVTGYTAPSSNYTLTQPSLTANITAAALTITGLTGVSRPYNGLTTATSTGMAAYAGLQNGETFVVTGTAVLNFTNALVGTGKTIVVTGYTAPSSNYTLTQPSLTANITAVALTITGLTGVERVYNGLTTATATGTAAYVGLQNGETFAVTGTAVFNFTDKNIGTAKPIIVTGYTAPSGNYTVTQPTGLTADITTAALTINGISGVNRAYNGLTNATSTGTAAYVGLQTGDSFPVVTGTAVLNFVDKNVGTGKTIVVTGYTAPSSNYTLTQPNLTANISAVALSITAVPSSKEYDGTTSSPVSPTIAGTIQTGDSANFIQVYDNELVATGKTLIPSGSVNDSNGGNNYSYTFINLSTGTPANRSITTRSMTITNPAVTSKIYDGTTAAVITGTLSGVVSGDIVTLNGTGTFATKHVGTGKPVTSTSTLSGTNASNYSLIQPTGLTGDITSRALTITGAATTKTYDAALTSVTVPTVTTGAIQTGDTAAFTQTYATKHVGTLKVMTPTGVVTDGNGGNNYSYTYTTSNNGTITARALTITGASNSKAYDGNISSANVPTVTGGQIQSGDTAAFTQTYTTENVGTGKVMTPTGVVTDGNSGNNYSYTYNTSSNGTITAIPLTITANNASKCAGTTYTFESTSFSAVGLLSGETIGGVTLNSAGANSGAAANTYAIVPSAATGGTFIAANYNITYQNGVFTVMALPVVTAANVSGCSGNDIALSGMPAGGTYSIANPYNGSSSTTYTYSYTDGNGCSNTSAIANVTIITIQTYYADTDGDGYGDPSSTVMSCTGAPLNYVSNNTDCNDNNINVHPNMSEILGNGIDDNCDGQIDEVTPLSNLVSTSCGITVTNFWNTLYAQQIAGAQGYRFKVVNGASVYIIEKATYYFSLNDLGAGAVYNSTPYTVTVSVKTDGYWRAYGSACTVTSPAVPPSASITNPICGSTLSNIWATIYCSQVSNATGYRFKVYDGFTTRTLETTSYSFSLMNLPDGGATLGRTYTVSVLLRFGSEWRPDAEYGPVCTFFTSAAPGSSRVVQPLCGTTITNVWTVIYAQQVTGAQGYRFVINDGVTAERTVLRSTANFQLASISGYVVIGRTYTIRVDVLYNTDQYVIGTTTCPITLASARIAVTPFSVVAYPNPFADNFKINVKSSDNGQVAITVYDMVGRIVEQRTAGFDELETVTIGDRYPSGVYNVIVTQNEEMKTLRVIKR